MRLNISAGDSHPKYTVSVFESEDSGSTLGGPSLITTSDVSIDDCFSKIIIKYENLVNNIITTRRIIHG